jgi:hypothetical protein
MALRPAPSAHRLSLSLRSAVAVQCSLSFGPRSSPRLLICVTVLWNVEHGVALLEGAALPAFSLQAMWLWCRAVGFTHSSHGHGPPHHQFVTVPRRYLIAVNLREHRHRHQHQHQAPSTTHRTHNTQHRNRMFECGVAVRSLLINQFPGSHGLRLTPLRCTRSPNFPQHRSGWRLSENIAD